MNVINNMHQFEFSFGNAPLFGKDIPTDKHNDVNFLKIADYNNAHHGIIDNDFIEWSLNNKISYEGILWFLKDFSHQSNIELLQLIDALFNHYTLYCDESNNCVKFLFKNESGLLNTDWKNDFVLAGIAFEGTNDPFDIDALFQSLNFQKTINEVKLKNISSYNGTDNNRLSDVLNSTKLNILLKKIAEYPVFLHWSTQSLLYYAIVDIVDAVFDIPLYLNETKNVLYKYIQKDTYNFLQFLAKYHYPNIYDKDTEDFCNELISWIEAILPETNEDEFCLELLKQCIKSARKNCNLAFLTNHKDDCLIDSFVPLYSIRLLTFPNSIFYFDQCDIVEKNIDFYTHSLSESIIPSYFFIDSKSSKWIQLSDIISGLIGALLTFINNNSLDGIKQIVDMYNTLQRDNLSLLMMLIEKSANHNKYFDHMSCNFHQYNGVNAIRKLLNINQI